MFTSLHFKGVPMVTSGLKMALQVDFVYLEFDLEILFENLFHLYYMLGT